MPELTEVIVGRIGRAHGVRGAVNVDVRTDEPSRRFVTGAHLLRRGGGELVVSFVDWQRGRLRLSFEGITDRTAAEALAGEELLALVEPGESPSGPEEYFDRHLVGLRVLRADGVAAGHVGAVLHLPAQDVLQVDTDSGPRLVPFVSALVPVVDVEQGWLQLADVGGLLEDAE